jgi:hypothetical protein
MRHYLYLVLLPALASAGGCTPRLNSGIVKSETKAAGVIDASLRVLIGLITIEMRGQSDRPEILFTAAGASVSSKCTTLELFADGAAVLIGSVKDGANTITAAIPRESVAQMAAAEKLNGMICDAPFVFKSINVERFKEFAAKLSVSAASTQAAPL